MNKNEKSQPAGRQGFTLIELLIVIAILGVLAAGVVAAINPGKRIRQANDAKIKNDIGQIATAQQGYATVNQVYTADTADLVTSGDLKVIPTAPTGSSYTCDVSVGCSTTSCEVACYADLLDPTTGLGVWCWKSTTGVAAELAACAL